MRTALALLLCAATGCVARGLDAGFDAGGHSFDLAGTPKHDLGTSGDAAQSSCMPLSWMPDLGVMAINEDPSMQPEYAWVDYVESIRSTSSLNLIDVLYFAHAQPVDAEPPVVPYVADLTFGSNDFLGLVLGIDENDGSGGTSFMATSGTVKVSAVDDTQPHGTVSVSGSDVELDEIDDSGQPVPNGACLTLASFDLTGSY